MSGTALTSAAHNSATGPSRGWTLAALGSSVLIGSLTGDPSLQGVAVALILILAAPTVALLAGTTPAIATLLATDLLAESGKRFIFLLGDPAEPIYLFVATSPLISGAITFAILLPRHRRRYHSLWPGVSEAAPLGHVQTLHGMGMPVLLVSWLALAWAAKWDVSGSADYVLLLAALLIGLVSSLEIDSCRWSRLLPRFFVALALVTVPFGVYQFTIGLLPWDRAWISGADLYSLQAAKIASEQAIVRPFSLYSDHTTWGLLLLAGLASTPHLLIPRLQRLTLDACLLVGLSLSLTRSIWVGALVTCALRFKWPTIGIRRLSRSRGSILAALGALLLVNQLVVSWLYETWVAVQPEGSTSALVQRATTLGTLAARTGGSEQAATMAASSPSNLLMGVPSSERIAADSHSLFGDLLLIGGLPLFVIFITLTIRALHSDDGSQSIQRLDWRTVIIIGFLIVGLVDGLAVIMVPYFWLAAIPSRTTSVLGHQ